MSDSSGLQDLRVVKLPLTPEQRDELSGGVLSVCSVNVVAQSDPTRWDEHKNIFFAASMIITAVIDQARGLLQRGGPEDKFVMKNMTVPEILQTLQQYPKLREMVRNACQTGALSYIADIEIFQIPQAILSDPYMPSAQDKDFLYDSFSRPYVGKAVDGFYEYLKDNNMKFKGRGIERPYYGKFCSIVQSSGTGKSRLLTELRNKGVLVLYMNLREPSDKGFPKRDPVPARILTEKLNCTRAEYTARCCALFTAIFQALQQRLSNEHRPGSDSQIKSWNDEMCDMRSGARTEFFEKVRHLYEQTLHKIEKDILDKTKKEALDKIEKQSLDKIQLMTPEKNADADRAVQTVEETAAKLGSLSLKGKDEEVPEPILEGESFVKQAYEEMLTVMSKIFTEKAEDKDFSDRPRLVISFDEAHSMSNMSSEGFRPSHILGRAINCYSKETEASVWVVFASTTSQVADFSAPQVIHDSLRVAVAGHLVFPPYTHLGWDQNADRLSDISANDVGKFDHIVGFGRPLWKSLVGKRSVANILSLAGQKLCKSKTFDPSDTNQALAVLSQRFGLDICFGHPDAVSYVEKGVASHLRICFSTTEDRSWAFTGYPSEPLLSCVAAILLHSRKTGGETTGLEDALRVLKGKVDGGMVEIGQSGELVSRLVLLLAKDLYIRSHLSKGTIQDLHYHGSGDTDLIDCQKVSVVDFLQHLFGETVWSSAGEKAKVTFRHAYINFSHWVPMKEFISPKDPKEPTFELSSAKEWTLRHWLRTSAVQCCHLQPLVDKMIPIYFDDPTLGSDDLEHMSQIFISDKAGKHSNARELAAITRKHDSINCLSALPYIAILLDFNAADKKEVIARFPERDPNHTETDRCLRIYAPGMNEITFPFLKESYVNVARLLHGLVYRETEAPTQTNLDALVRFGSTARSRNLQWEKQG